MKLVLCEGEDDKKVISGLCEANSIDGLEVQPYKGRDNLRAFVRALRQRPDFVQGEIESIGIVQDADQDGRAAWERVRDAVEAAFGVVLVEPAKPVGERPRIAGFVLARQGEDRGVLEDLCLTAVSHQAGYSCLEDYFRCLTEKTGKQTFHPKAKFRAWMASQSDYDLRTGLAAEQGYVPYTNAAFDALRDFLRGL